MEESIKELPMAAFDRFSGLPEHIVHHIMSFLPTTSATRVSALSKNFNSAWLSYPVFDFDQALYEKVIRPSGDRTSCEKPDFLDFVLDSLKKHSPSNIYMQRFSLRVWPHEISDNRIQNSIRLAVDRNVNELVVEIQGLQDNYFRSARTLALQNDELFVEMEENDELFVEMEENNELFVEIEGLENNYCSLPRTALQNAKSLSVLKLSGFSLELEDLIPCLNLVEDLSLESCSVSANFMLSSDKLTDLNLRFCEGLEKIEIDALNLQSFSYTACHIEQRPCEINLSRFKNLKNLTIEGSAISDEWLEYQVPKFVLLRNLKLIACKNLQKIKISNRQLRSFELLECEKLWKVKIEAPNLISFDYSGNIFDTTSPPKIILLCSTLAHVKLSLTTTRELTASSFLNLSSLLTRFGHCKTLSLSLQSDQELIFPEKVRECLVNPLLDLRHMRVELLRSLSSLTGLVDGLLWLAPNLETMFISVQLKPLMLDLLFYKWRPRGENQMIKKVTLVKYEGHDDDRKSLLSFFHEKAITVEVNSDH